MQPNRERTEQPQKADWHSPIQNPMHVLSRNVNSSKLLEENQHREGGEGENNYLFRKLQDAFEIMTERIADQFTLSEYNKFRAGEGLEKPNKKSAAQVEWVIHNLRSSIRVRFNAIFEGLCQEMRVAECLQAAGTEIEKQRTLKELEFLTGSFINEGTDHYFDFLQSVLSRLKLTNEKLMKGPDGPLGQLPPNHNKHSN